MSLSSFIRDEASRLGFAAVGIASVGPSQTIDRYKTWLSRGYAGGMTYLTRHADLRADPRRIMPEARSIVVVAARYPSDRTIAPFSNYCRGRDYHDVLRKKLKQLARRIEERNEAPLLSRICVDTAPILEREWAVRAGLGWIGRQGSLVNPEWGCTLFLGELLVDLELTPSKPVSHKCGACRRCLEACPTGAIQSDGCVDARRCIAYLTIEHEGDIPEDLRLRTGTSIFGCDRCTSVCPFNRIGENWPTAASRGRRRRLGQDTEGTAMMPEFNPPNQPLPTPELILAMTELDFQQRFQGTSVYRSGLARLQRNARIVICANSREMRPKN